MSNHQLFSIGHSNHEPNHFVDLLVHHQIEVVADVRTTPRSGYSPQFNQASLRQLLAESGIRYLFLGDTLGGRPADEAMYDDEDHVRYDKVAQSPEFRQGLRRLVEGSRTFRVAIMCGEENPTDCHRRLLIGRVLAEEGIDLAHIRSDGRVQHEADLPPLSTPIVEISLFGEERASWRSTRPVSRSGPPASSSTP